MSYKIFLSHSGKDKEWVELIALKAEEVGVETYLFEHDPKPGCYLADKIKEEIRGADALVVLITPNSQYSPYVQQEIGYAEDRIPIIPLVDSSMEDVSLAMLEGREYVQFDFENPSDSDTDLLSFLSQLKTDKREKSNRQILALGGLLLLIFLFGDKE